MTLFHAPRVSERSTHTHQYAATVVHDGVDQIDGLVALPIGIVQGGWWPREEDCYRCHDLSSHWRDQMPAHLIGQLSPVVSGSLYHARRGYFPIMDRVIRIAHYGAHSGMGVHHHETASLSIVVSGLYEERVRGRISEHGPGNLLFHPAFELHSQRFHANGVCQILITPTHADIEFLGEHLRLREARYVQSAAVRDLGARLVAELHNEDAFSSLIVHGLTLEAFGLFCRTTGRERADIRPWLREARALIDSHLGEPLSLEELGRMVGRHPVHLARAFRQAYGQTVGECTRHARIQTAARLLVSSHKPISVIAMECGFCDQAHLSRAFKRVFGVTPAAYRAR